MFDQKSAAASDKKTHLIQIPEMVTILAAFNSLSDGLLIMDKMGEVIFINPLAKKFLGIGSESIALNKGTAVAGCFYPDKITPYPLQKLLLAPTGDGDSIHSQRIFIKNSTNPEGIDISLDVNPVRSEHGLVIGISVVFRDISETIESEIYLNESRERLSTQLKGFPQPTYVWQNVGDDFILVDYNQAAKKFGHGSINKHLGIKLSEMYADSPEILADFKACFDKKSVLNREITYAFKNNHKQRNWIVNYVFLPPDSIMVHTEDITERKNNERELRKLSSAIEETTDSVILTDKNGIIEYVNPAFEKTTGFTSAEVIGKTPAILKSGHHDAKFYKTLWEVILGGDPYTGTILNKKKDGLFYWCEQSITPMKNENGKITNFVSVIKDISELKKKQEQDFYLRIATEVQQRLSKTKFSVPGFDIAGSTHSALETSGDYFDFLHTVDGQILLVVGDVSGHGIGAALIMAETRAFLRAFAKRDSDPANILKMLNEELISDLDDKNYVTLIIARIDPYRNTLDYASAGHIPAYLMDNKGKVKHILNSTGIPLGFISEEKFLRSEQIALKAGDILALLTDGITEAIKNDECEFGYHRTIDLINNFRMDSAKQITDHLTQAVCSFTELRHQEDDITAVICKVN
jgi:sigma-B regulation protein RsbU (phosphoserine phosphatase)